eukprot:15473563-Alexandrium_andersonii.AAC.1
MLPPRTNKSGRASSPASFAPLLVGRSLAWGPQGGRACRQSCRREVCLVALRLRCIGGVRSVLWSESARGPLRIVFAAWGT